MPEIIVDRETRIRWVPATSKVIEGEVIENSEDVDPYLQVIKRSNIQLANRTGIPVRLIAPHNGQRS